MPAGRPSEMSEEKVKKLEEIFALDGTIEEACFFANITKTTYYNWLEKNPELIDRFQELRNTPVLKARRTVVNDLKNYQNAMDYLKRKRRLEFGDNVDITSNNKPIPLLGGKSNGEDNNSDKETPEIKEEV